MSGLTILCIDDEEIGLEIRKIILEREGYLVLTARDGLSGLDIFESQTIDAVVLDYAMPGMDGGRVAAAMRCRKPSVPILMLSAYVSLPQEIVELVDFTMVKGNGGNALLDILNGLLGKALRPDSTSF